MEHTFHSTKLKNIFLHNGNWWKLFLKHRDLIKPNIIVNVIKFLACKTPLLGCHIFTCPKCNKSIKTFHSCKSRFCPSCGKKATDNWIKTQFNILPKTTWQHITFTMDALLWPVFQYNRYLLNKIPPIAANIILNKAETMNFLPGIFLAIHTFGRQLPFNVHIHLSTTIAGLSLSDNLSSWSKNAFFHHLPLKRQWKFAIINLLRQEFKKGNLCLPSHLNYLQTYSAFSSWLNYIYTKSEEWNVQLSKPSDDMKINIDYLGKYLKRPPIGESRILAYDGTSVTFKFFDHHSKQYDIFTLPVLEFIARLIRHIPDKNFKMIRYYGFLANRVRSIYLPRVRSLLKIYYTITKKVFISWRQMIRDTFKYDPLRCPICNSIMTLTDIHLSPIIDILSLHKEIANGYFPLL